MFYVDVDMDIQGVASLDGNEDSVKAYMMESGIFGSYMESVILEQTLGIPSVSTASILNEANNRGIGIVTLESGDEEIMEEFN